jgi:hypothetical protein
MEPEAKPAATEEVTEQWTTKDQRSRLTLQK